MADAIGIAIVASVDPKAVCERSAASGARRAESAQHTQYIPSMASGVDILNALRR